MSTRSSVALVTALCLSVSACATAPAPYQGPSHESRALSVVTAVDLVGLKDAKQSQGASVSSPGSTLPGAAFTGGLNSLSAPPGFSSLGAGLMGFASAFFSGPGPEAAASTSRVIAWMPLSEAETPDAAIGKLDQMVQARFAEVLSRVDLGEGYSAQTAEKDTGGYRRTTVMVKGGECDEPKVRCAYGLTSLPRPVQGFAPAFLGGYPAWSYTRTSGIPILEPSFRDHRSWRASFRATFPDLEVYRRLSAALPDWVYLYLAPQRVSYWNEQQQRLQFLPYPVVLNRGEALFFVRIEP